jgi:hypothetical protein
MSAMINGNSKYSKQYLDGNTVYANENTVGILVFETLEAAYNWAAIWNDGDCYDDPKDLVVLKVFPIGRGRKNPPLASGITTEDLDKFYSKGPGWPRGESPDRTMAYPCVEVMGEYKWA